MNEKEDRKKSKVMDGVKEFILNFIFVMFNYIFLIFSRNPQNSVAFKQEAEENDLQTRQQKECEASTSKTQSKTEDAEDDREKTHKVLLALQSKQFAVYEDLLSRDLPRLNDKVYHEMIKGFDEESKDKLDEIHRKFIKNPSEEHLISLLKRTGIFFEGQRASNEQPYYTSLIAKVYEELNSIPEIQVCLKFVSHFTNLSISLDINQESVVYLDSKATADVKGRTSTEVFIGAKGFNWSNDGEGTRDEYFKVLGVLAHVFISPYFGTLLHFALLFKYNNDYKPYDKDDVASENEFEKVLDTSNEKRAIKEDIIESALNAENVEILHDELIVCVPHILARYKENNEKLKELRCTFYELFDFFNRKTLPDLKAEIELITAVSKLKANEPKIAPHSEISFNSPFDINLNLKAEKFLKISSNCHQLTMHIIYQQMYRMPRLPTSFIFLNLREAMKDIATINLLQDAFGSCLTPTFICDCENVKSSEVASFAQRMETKGINRRIIFVHNFEFKLMETSVHRKLSYSWKQLENVSKANLMRRKIKFQGEELSLDEIVNISCEVLDKISLDSLLNNKLEIDKDLEFSESEFYIGRKLLHGSSEIVTNQLVENAKIEKIVLLSADPGMGKTTELMMTASKIKKLLPNYWVAFVDLKIHFKSYDKGEKVETVFNSRDDIAKFFAEKILNIKNFEADIFKELFRNNCVALLMDGFDEICPTFNIFMKKLLLAIKNLSKNILIVSTRPHHKRKLRNELGVETYTFCPLTDKNCNDLIEKKFDKSKFSEGDFDEILQNTKEFLSKINAGDKMNNPMLLSMIAEVFTSNHETARAAQPNIFWIYKEFVNIMIDKSLDKGYDARKEHIDAATTNCSIMHFYQKEAFKIIYHNRMSQIDRTVLEVLFKNCQTPHEDLKTRNSLMKSDGSGNFQFVHRTFAEFLVVDFIFTNLFDTRTKNVDKKRKRAAKTLFQECCLYFIDGTFVDFLVHSFPEDVTTRSYRYEKTKLHKLSIKDKDEPNPFISLAELKILQINEKFFYIFHDFFDTNDVKKYFIFDTISGSVLKSALTNDDPRVADFYCDRVKELFPGDESLEVLKQSFYPLNALRKHLRSHDLNKFQDELDQIEKDHGLDYLKLLLVSRLLRGSKTIYFEACEVLNSLEDFEFLWKILKNNMGDDAQKLFHETDKSGATPLMYKTKKPDKVFMKFWELIEPKSSKQLLKINDSRGYDVFYHATQSKYPDTFNAIKKLYLETFNEDEIKILLKGHHMPENILSFATAGSDNGTTFRALWEFLHEVFDKNTIINSFLLPTYVCSWSPQQYDRLPRILESIEFQCS